MQEEEEENYTDGDMCVSDNGEEHQHDVAEENPESDPAETKLSRTRALLEFRFKVEEAIVGDYLFAKSPQRDFKNELWGVPLFPSEGHPGTDIVLAKFLKAKQPGRGYAVLAFRDESALVRQRQGQGGRPMCYNLWGKESQNESWPPLVLRNIASSI